jgi:transcription elongation factor GreA
MKDVYLTKDGLEKLQHELKQLIENDRKEIIAKIKEAREYGDLSENAEYDAAVNQQAIVEGRIEEIETLLKKAQIIESPANTDKVRIGCKVEVEVEGETEKFSIVGTAESNPAKGLISIESPLGKALLGRKVADTAEVGVPDGGTVAYKILKIS